MHTLKADPKALAQAHEDATAREADKAVDHLLCLVDTALLDEQKRMSNGGASRGYTRVEVTAERPIIDRAVQTLKQQGFKARYDHDEADDDGPGRYSPARDFIVINY